MNIDKKYRLERCVSTDESRPNLQNIYVSRRHGMATNGHILAVVPVKSCKDDSPGWLTIDALRLARKVMPKGSDDIVITLNGEQILSDGTTLTRPNGENKPPRLYRILKNALSNRTIRVGLNAGYLKDLADGLGTEEIVLEIGNPDTSIAVRPVHNSDGTAGVIMPIRLSQKEH